MAIALLGMGCKQSVGERCQRTRDCEPGLTCLLPTSWKCPDGYANCPACLPGGTCQNPSDEQRRCAHDSDCAPGLSCVPSGSCGEEGAWTCSGLQPDMTVLDLGEADL